MILQASSRFWAAGGSSDSEDEEDETTEEEEESSSSSSDEEGEQKKGASRCVLCRAARCLRRAWLDLRLRMLDGRYLLPGVGAACEPVPAPQLLAVGACCHLAAARKVYAAKRWQALPCTCTSEHQSPRAQQSGNGLMLCLLRRFMVGSSDSDSEDDKRVVRSAKDKRFEELQSTCDEIRVRCCSV